MALFEIDNDYIKSIGEVGLPKLIGFGTKKLLFQNSSLNGTIFITA